MQKVIIILGSPASGKSYLARDLSAKLSLPLIARDDYKETLFNVFGSVDREWSKMIGKASYILMYQTLRSVLHTRSSCIIESNFNPDFDQETFTDLSQEYGFIADQLICHADEEVLIKRFKERAETAERHPGHGSEIDDGILAQFKKKPRAFDLPGKVIEINTTDFTKVNVGEIIEQLS